MIGKHVLYLLIICIGCTLAACNPSSDENVKAKLVQAENIMYSAPDSALQLLEHLQPPKEKEQRATWALLLAQARYRNNVKQSDSLVNVAYMYFEKTDNAERKALALYLKGGLEKEAKHVNEAQALYLKAKKNAANTNNYRLKYLIDSNLCNLYAYQNLKEYALASIEDANQSAQQLGDTTYLLSIYLFKARVHSLKPYDEQEVVHYYTKGIELAKVCNNWNRLEGMIWELAGFYSTIKQYGKALEIIRQGMNLYNENRPCPARSLGIIGEVYSNLGMEDSASHYLQKAIQSTKNPNIKGNAYDCLQLMYGRNGKYKEAWLACKQALHLYDSIRLAERTDELIEMQAKYDQQKVIIERNELQLKKERMTRNYLFISIIIVIIVGIIIGMYQRALVKKEKLLKKQEDAMQQAKLRMNENEFIIERNKQKIAELDLQIKASNKIKELLEEERTAQKELQQQNQSLIDENVLLQRKMEQYSLANEAHSNTLQELNKLIIRNKYLHERELFLSECLVKTNPILNRVKTKHAYIEDIQWKQLKEELNLIFDNYIERLLKLAPSISERELHLSCLIKLKMSNIDMGDALGISPSSVAKLKQRLKDRLSTEIPSFDKSMLLDVWLWDF